MDRIPLKLIAIKPRYGCAPRFLKVLRIGKPYFFYKNYSIDPLAGDTELIKQTGTHSPTIYDIKNAEGEPIAVEISAIVGKNGSGKSSLVELLYVALYNLAFIFDLLEKPKRIKDTPVLVRNIFVDIYYQIDNEVCRLRVKDEKAYLLFVPASGIAEGDGSELKDRIMLTKLFYTIVINYSQYGLNTRELGKWIKSIFHKNDGYQTPIVLNPFRNEGNININSENYLVRSRLLANILDDRLASLHFDNKKKIPKRFRFSFDPSKFKGSREVNRIMRAYRHQFHMKVLPDLYSYFFGISLYTPDDTELNRLAEDYIFRKLISITQKYKFYEEYAKFYLGEDKQLVTNFLTDLDEDDSHVTFKLRQALNFIRFNKLLVKKRSFKLDVSKVAQYIADVHKKHPNIPTIELVPPAFFGVDIIFENQHDLFSHLSSGEKQKIYALSSLVYHLRNLDSVREKPMPQENLDQLLVKYEHVNIIFDEIELYYHPDLQRRFIKDLLDNLSEAKLKTILSINLVFVTHSPFILSDIPSNNALYLEYDPKEKKAKSVDREGNTFGGNIHDLLANSFFLDDTGYMGEFAKEKIHSAAKFLKLRIIKNKYTEYPEVEDPFWDQEKVRQFISMIGEPLIATSLLDLYTEAYLKDDDALAKEISRLQEIQASRKGGRS